MSKDSSFDELRKELKKEPKKDTARKLLVVPNPILRQKCEPADISDKSLHELIREMKEYMYAHRTDELAPIGLTAPQFGELVRVIVFYPSPHIKKLHEIQELINPEIIRSKGHAKVTETCLSLPGKRYIVERAKLIKIRGYTVYGQKRSFKSEGLVAQVFQHEMNHLDGVLIDKIGELIVR